MALAHSESMKGRILCTVNTYALDHDPNSPALFRPVARPQYREATQEEFIAALRVEEIAQLMEQLRAMLKECGTYEEVLRNTPQVPIDAYL